MGVYDIVDETKIEETVDFGGRTTVLLTPAELPPSIVVIVGVGVAFILVTLSTVGRTEVAVHAIVLNTVTDLVEVMVK